VFFELKLVNYYPLELETWIVIGAAWIFFLLGSITVVVARFALKGKTPLLEYRIESTVLEKELKQIKTILWVFNIVSLIVAIHNLYLVSKLFGGLTNAFILGNLLYKVNVSEGLRGSIPFFSSLVFPAIMLAGSYTEQKGKITLVSVVPLIVVIMLDIAKMGRADIIMGVMLFMCGYFLTSKQKSLYHKKPTLMRHKYAILFVFVAIAVSGGEFIRSTRKAQEGFIGTTEKLQRLSTVSFITPSIYLYVSSHPAILNQYLKHGGEKTPFGGHTFNPFYRWLEKLGLEIHADPFQVWYKTPVILNTGTYLRELHGDFGMTGLLLGPYFLGFLASIFWYRVKDYGKYRDLSIVAFLYVIIGMSFFMMATRLGELIIYLVAAIIIGSILDRRLNKIRTVN